VVLRREGVVAAPLQQAEGKAGVVLRREGLVALTLH
jgi:hypothetical protein